MKYHNGKAMSVAATQPESNESQGAKYPKPPVTTDYVRWVEREVERREREGKTFGV